MISQLLRLSEAFISGIGKTISWLTLMMVLTMTGIVLFHAIVNKGSIAVQESITYMHAALFMLAAAYTLQQDRHVRVDIFYQHFSPGQKIGVNIFGTLCFLFPLCFFLIVQSWDYVALAWNIRETSSEAGGLAYVYILKTILIIMPALLLLQGLNHLTHCFLTLIKSNPDE